MRTITFLALLFLTTLLPATKTFAQCASAVNIYSFTYNNKAYEVIKENKTWTEAAACAASRGGYLVEINDADEQQAVFDAVLSAGITAADTEAEDGFGSYVWLGGNDITTEGFWALNGDNDDQAVFFWQGTASGSAMNNRYNNWGNEPDNWGPEPGQDALGMAIIDFPNGAAGKWNDLNHNNELFFVVEHNSLLSTQSTNIKESVAVYPNPSEGFLQLSNALEIREAVIFNATGQQVLVLTVKELASGGLSTEQLPAGVYFINMMLIEGTTTVKTFIKK